VPHVLLEEFPLRNPKLTRHCGIEFVEVGQNRKNSKPSVAVHHKCGPCGNGVIGDAGIPHEEGSSLSFQRFPKGTFVAASSLQGKECEAEM
jgi:hypothetical protein